MFPKFFFGIMVIVWFLNERITVVYRSVTRLKKLTYIKFFKYSHRFITNN